MARAEGAGDRNGKQENTCVTLAGSGEGPGAGLQLGLPDLIWRPSLPAGLPPLASLLPSSASHPALTRHLSIPCALRYIPSPTTAYNCPPPSCLIPFLTHLSLCLVLQRACDSTVRAVPFQRFWCHLGPLIFPPKQAKEGHLWGVQPTQ